MSNLAKRIIEGKHVKDWLKPDKYGTTPLHDAAINGYLDQVPKEILTAENMLVKNNIGTTPLHDAAINGHLDQVPIETLAQLKQAGELDSYELEDELEEPLSRKIVDYLISHSPYDPFDL